MSEVYRTTSRELFHGHHPECAYTVEGDPKACGCEVRLTATPPASGDEPNWRADKTGACPCSGQCHHGDRVRYCSESCREAAHRTPAASGDVCPVCGAAWTQHGHPETDVKAARIVAALEAGRLAPGLTEATQPSLEPSTTYSTGYGRSVPASGDVQAARAALRFRVGSHAYLIDAFEAEARAAALDEARAAVQDTRRSLTAGPGQDATDVHIAWALGEALAAIDALREGEL